MNSNNKDDASNTQNPGPLGVANQHKNTLPDVVKKDTPRRESTVLDDKAAVLSREKSATAREDAADVREDAVHLRETAAQAREGEAHVREGIATSREQEIRTAETMQAASQDQVSMLQQANAHLVIATLEAQKMAEQIETAKGDLDYLAHHDALTDLLNRILLQDRLGQAIELARCQGGQLAVMFMDLDQFKHINDSLGHALGDQLLQSVAQRLVGCARQSDTISRQGGDEFVLLLPYIEQAEDSSVVRAKDANGARATPSHRSARSPYQCEYRY